MKIKCVIDSKNYYEKPQDSEVGGIVNRMTIDKAKEYSIQEIKDSIIQGKTIRPSLCGCSEDSWILQQMFMIDIDNKPSKTKGMSNDEYEELCRQYIKTKHRTYAEVIEKCKAVNLVPNFIYTSFNHSESHHKMRLVYIVDKEISDLDTVKKIQLFLMDSIGDVDEQCNNLNRIYYGGKNIFFETDDVLDTDRIIELSKDIKIEKKATKGSAKSSNSTEGFKGYNILDKYNSFNILYPQNPLHTESDYNISAISNRNIEFLKSKINNEYIEFDSISEFWQYIYCDINMVELLEIKYPKSFRCIIHNDNNRSASIFQNGEGVWLYNCFSSNCGVVMNNKQLIEKLGNFKSEYKAIEFIKSIFNLSIKETSWSIEQKANLDSILYKLDMNIFSEWCPQADKNLRYVKELFSVMVHIAKDNVYGENYCNSDGDVVFFVSLKELAKILKVPSNKLTKLSQRISQLVYHNLIRKLDDNKIPPEMLKKAQAIAINNRTDKRVNFYSIPSWVFEHLNSVEFQGNKWKEKGYTLKGASYEMYYRGEGLSVAQYIYPQHKKIKSNHLDIITGEVTSSVVDRTTSHISDERVSKIVSAMDTLISKRGYTTEKRLVFYLSDEYKWDITELQLRKIRGQLKQLGFKRIRANKLIKENYGMAGEGYPFIIVKNKND